LHGRPNCRAYRGIAVALPEIFDRRVGRSFTFGAYRVGGARCVSRSGPMVNTCSINRLLSQMTAHRLFVRQRGHFQSCRPAQFWLPWHYGVVDGW
ncbi:hypothetical protein, partial [Micromonospora sp. NPDC005171]|uniref:hypothetical protein n=1 Tax=Micromonospora sp. NPDC005171 TaxID=3156866 RepID=UPI0033A69141